MNKTELIKLINDNEKTYHGRTHKIKYLFIPCEESEHLAVIFSGFHGKEAAGKAPVYNYINTIENVKVNKLFIIDGVNDVPVYYYGINKRPTYLNDVVSLISIIAKENRINLRRIIFGGSSKGGTGALLVGLSMNVGHIISGANQVRVGRYIDSRGRRLKTSMFGTILGEYNKNSAQLLDDIFLSRLMVNKTRSNLYFHGGNGDGHYKTHMKPLLAHYDEHDIKYELDLRDYINHNSVVYFFPKYLKRKIEEIIELPRILIPDLTFIENRMKISVNTSYSRAKTFYYRVYIYKNNGEILRSKYLRNKNHSFDIDKEEVKSIKIFLKEFERLRDVRTFTMKTLMRGDTDE